MASKRRRSPDRGQTSTSIPNAPHQSAHAQCRGFGAPVGSSFASVEALATIGEARARALQELAAGALFRDGAVALVQFPPRDFCLSTLGMFELGLDPRDVLPALRSDRSDSGPVVR